ncbi:universal stress protein [Planctomycetota bacterium]
MKRFKNILIYVDPELGDDDQNAFAKATALAKANDAVLTVLDVFRAPPAYTGALSPDERLDDLIEDASRKRRKFLETLAEPIRKEGIVVTTAAVCGAPFVEIIRRVLRDGHDLVIKTASERRWFKRLFFGTTALHLLRKCPCPVWLVKHKPAKPERILAAINPISQHHRTLSRTILELAGSLADARNSELHVLHCWRLPDEGILELSLSDRELRQRRDAVRKRVSLHFTEFIVELIPSIRSHQVHLVGGHPAHAIPRFVSESKIAIVVMGTIARTGVPGLLIGNNAEKIVEQVECGVLAVKPRDFVSPVT